MSDLPLETLLAHRVAALTTEADELEAAAKIAAQNGMYHSGSTLSNRAAGIRRALEVLNPQLSTDVPQ